MSQTENKSIPLKKIVFILNPFSGVEQKQLIEKQIHEYIDKNKYNYSIVYTEYPHHATELAAEAVKNNFDMVVAVGGDGSVNEVAAALIGSNVILGILPAGSGNGFAMHLGLGRNIRKAINILNNGRSHLVDTCTINGKPFVNLAGLGFDAKIAYRYKRVKKRGFWGYFKFSLQETQSFEFQHYTIKIDGKKVTNRKCLSVVVANAPMYGYHFVVAPKAVLDDGKLEIVVFYKAKMWRYFFSLWRMLTHSMHNTMLADRFSGEEVEVTFFEPQAYAHTDGEGFLVSEKQIFKIVPKSLYVWRP
jgi:diacylglycerol kinase (ATP)